MVLCAWCRLRIRSSDVRANGARYHTKCYQEQLKESRALRQGSISLPFPKVDRRGTQKKQCVFRDCTAIPAVLQSIRKSLRIRVCAFKRCIIKIGAKCCTEHMAQLQMLDFEVEQLHVVSDESHVSLTEARRLLIGFQEIARAEYERASKPRTFETKTDEELFRELKLTRDQFNYIKEVSGLTGYKSDLTLYIYLLKMSSGLSEKRIGFQLGLERPCVNFHVQKARKALNENFVPSYLGFDSISREGIYSHNTEIARHLFSPDKPRVMLVLDGTYIDVQKSSNFKFQRQSFSQHKHKNLIKMFMVVLTDGLPLEATGPFGANISDSDLLEDFLGSEGFKGKFNPADVVLIVDRGFRDALSSLENKDWDYKVYMPEFIERGKSQLTTEEANRSRLVTKVRFIVEMVNSQVKEDFLYFDKRVSNKALKSVPTDFRICVSLLRYRKQGGIFTDKEDVFIAERMLSLAEKPNRLADMVISGRLTRVVSDRSSKFAIGDQQQNIDFYFPRFTTKQLKQVFCGSYQLEMARSYYAEHVKETGLYKYYIQKEVDKFRGNFSQYFPEANPESLTLISCRVQSRHSNAVRYCCFLLVNKDKPLIDQIETYCTCKAGRRTIGTCGHCACFIWYLSHARYLDVIRRKGAMLDDYFSQVLPLPVREVQENDEIIEVEDEDLIDNGEFVIGVNQEDEDHDLGEDELGLQQEILRREEEMEREVENRVESEDEEEGEEEGVDADELEEAQIEDIDEEREEIENEGVEMMEYDSDETEPYRYSDLGLRSISDDSD